MKILAKIKDFALDTLFPIRCLSCHREGAWFCSGCLEKMPLRKDQTCPLCEKKITPGGRICFSCRRKSALDGLLVAASYKDIQISSAVHCYKYRFAEKMHEPLGELLSKAFLRANLALPDAIVPVPLHPRRLRWRGFNQAGLLARYLCENLAPGFPIPVLDDILIRRRYTYPQMQIKNHLRRRKNIENAFTIKSLGDSDIKNKKILLIDDIATTGSTLFECAKILKNAGAREVFAAVIARQEIK